MHEGGRALAQPFLQQLRGPSDALRVLGIVALNTGPSRTLGRSCTYIEEDVIFDLIEGLKGAWGAGNGGLGHLEINIAT